VFTRANTYPLSAKWILQEHRPRRVLADDLEPVVGARLLDAIVGGETVLGRHLLGLLREVGRLVALVAHDCLLCLLHYPSHENWLVCAMLREEMTVVPNIANGISYYTQQSTRRWNQVMTSTKVDQRSSAAGTGVITVVWRGWMPHWEKSTVHLGALSNCSAIERGRWRAQWDLESPRGVLFDVPVMSEFVFCPTWRKCSAPEGGEMLVRSSPELNRGETTPNPENAK
jgi:hypothetical protein